MSRVNKKERYAKELKSLSLGKQSTYQFAYNPKLLEAFPNRHPVRDNWTSLICPEFTSLCPKTGQPDFATIIINYIANERMVESKSLKLYLFSYRNHGDFHEDCVQKICQDLVDLLKPRYLEVFGEFNPRGGISIYPYAQHANNKKKFQDLKKERFASYNPQNF